MTICSFCGDDFEKLNTCKRCEKRFCDEDGDAEQSICKDCLDEENEAEEDLAEDEIDKGIPTI